MLRLKKQSYVLKKLHSLITNLIFLFTNTVKSIVKIRIANPRHRVKIKTEGDPLMYTVAVTDMTFNPTISVFEHKLKTPDGRKVTQDYWNQKTEETNPHYWNYAK